MISSHTYDVMSSLPPGVPGLACPRCGLKGWLLGSRFSPDDNYSLSLPWVKPVECLLCKTAMPFYMCTKCKSDRAFHGGRDLLYHCNRCPADAENTACPPSSSTDIPVEEVIEDSPAMEFPSGDDSPAMEFPSGEPVDEGIDDSPAMEFPSDEPVDEGIDDSPAMDFPSDELSSHPPCDWECGPAEGEGDPAEGTTPPPAHQLLSSGRGRHRFIFCLILPRLVLKSR
jgi:hypothetical protein